MSVNPEKYQSVFNCQLMGPKGDWGAIWNICADDAIEAAEKFANDERKFSIDPKKVQVRVEVSPGKHQVFTLERKGYKAVSMEPE
jgi:hypothetical protein